MNIIRSTTGHSALRRLTAAVLLGAPAFSAAQEPVAAVDEEIVVTGRGLDDRPGDRASSVVTVSRDEILANAAGRLESVLADAAGIQQFRRSDSRSANPTSQGVSLRGIGGNASSRALLILDGVPQADPFGGWVAFPAYAPERLGRVRITRGGGSGYWGPGALAGTIELESATPDQLDRGTISLSGGSRGLIDAGAGAALVRPGGFATVSGSYAGGDGFVPIVADDRGPVDRAARYRQWSAALRSVIALPGRTEMQVGGSAFGDRRERGTAFTVNRSEGLDGSIRLIGRGDWRWAALAYVQSRDFASQFAGVDAARTAATLTLDQKSTPATGIGGRIEVSPPLGQGIDLRLGADLRDVSGRTNELFTFVAGSATRRRIAGGASRTAGAFADLSVERGAWTFDLGGRVDRWRIVDGRLVERTIATGLPINDLRFPDRRGTEATGRVGFSWRAASAVTLRAAGYRGWRLPTLNELYRPFRAGPDATAPNPALAPERLIGAEAGATFGPARGFSLSATLFANRLDGAIANLTAGTGPGQFPLVGFVAAGGTYRVRANLDAIRATGVELDASWRSGPWLARAGWTRVDSRVRGGALAGLRPAQTPRTQLSAALSWTRDGYNLHAAVRRVGDQFEDDLNSRTLAAATTADLSATIPLTRALALEFAAENITDALVPAAVSAGGVIERATPQTLRIGARMRF